MERLQKGLGGEHLSAAGGYISQTCSCDLALQATFDGGRQLTVVEDNPVGVAT